MELFKTIINEDSGGYEDIPTSFEEAILEIDANTHAYEVKFFSYHQNWVHECGINKMNTMRKFTRKELDQLMMLWDSRKLTVITLEDTATGKRFSRYISNITEVTEFVNADKYRFALISWAYTEDPKHIRPSSYDMAFFEHSNKEAIFAKTQVLRNYLDRVIAQVPAFKSVYLDRVEAINKPKRKEIKFHFQNSDHDTLQMVRGFSLTFPVELAIAERLDEETVNAIITKDCNRGHIFKSLSMAIQKLKLDEEIEHESETNDNSNAIEKEGVPAI